MLLVSSSALIAYSSDKRLAKALIRLRICAGWSKPLLIAHTTLLEISCHGSFSLKALIVCRGFVFGPCFLVQYLVSFLICNHHAGEKFNLIVFLMSCFCMCSVSLPQGAVG